MSIQPIRLLGVALVTGTIFLAACGGASQVTTDPQQETTRQAEITRSVLADAGVAARAYGQDHLGHYVDLTKRELIGAGLKPHRGVTLEIRARHMTFCIQAMNEALPSIHPWAVATVTLRDARPSSRDGCRS
jgi:hypothetical protein